MEQRVELEGEKDIRQDAINMTPSRLSCFKQLRDELTCAVCLDICVRPCTTPCGHNYCRSCLRRNLELNRPCPKCRASLPAGFSLNINTTLWNTIQHLFPAEASSKPLTPQPAVQPVPQAYAAMAQSVGSASGNPAAAPFRPPRFVAAGAPAGQQQAHPYVGSISGSAARSDSRTAAPTMGLASRSGRSVSGPRLQPQPATAFYAQQSAVRAGPSAEMAQSYPETGAPAVFEPPSLAQLGVSGVRGAAVTRRDRRRSRSADRWEHHSMLLAPAAVNGREPSGGGVLRAGPVTVAAESHPAQPSLLMRLLAEGPLAPHSTTVQAQPPSRPAAPTTNSGVARSGPVRNAPLPVAPLKASSGASSERSMSLNPFMRALRPLQTRTAAAADAASISSGSSQHGGSSSVPSTAVAASARSFTASQRALLAATRVQQGPPSAPGAAATAGRSAGSAVLASVLSAAEVLSEASSVCCEPSDVGAHSGRSSSCIHDDGVLESGSVADPDQLSCDDRPFSLRAGSVTTASSVSSACSRRLALCVELNSSASIRMETAPACSAPASASNSGRGSQRLSGETRFGPGKDSLALPDLSRLRLDDDPQAGEEELTLGTLGGFCAACPGAAAGPLQAAETDMVAPACVGDAGPSSPSGAQTGSPSPACALEPLLVTPPSLPRLRLPARKSPAQGAAPHADDASVGTTSIAAGGSALRVPVQSAVAMDPDLPDNYDGDDPAAADTFFSSPFFDRTMLWDTLRSHDGEDEDEAGSEAGFSPGWAAARAGSRGLQHLDSASALLKVQEAEGAGVGLHGAVASAGTVRAGIEEPVDGAAVVPSSSMLGPEARAADGQTGSEGGNGFGSGHGALALPSLGLRLPACALARPQPQEGDKERPIEILTDSSEGSDSDDDVVEVAMPEVPARRAYQSTQQAAVGRVVAGLRRPGRS